MKTAVTPDAAATVAGSSSPTRRPCRSKARYALTVRVAAAATAAAAVVAAAWAAAAAAQVAPCGSLQRRMQPSAPTESRSQVAVVVGRRAARGGSGAVGRIGVHAQNVSGSSSPAFGRLAD